MPAFTVVRPGANIQGPVLDWFLRSDSATGINMAGTAPPEAVAQLQQLIAQGVVAPTDNTGLSVMAQYGIVGAPDYSLVGALGGTTAQAFGQIPGLPPGQQPTLQMRQLLVDALNADRNAQLARDQFEQAVRAGDREAAQRALEAERNYTLQARNLDQQASQFAQTFGLQAQEQTFRQQLATQAFAEQQREFNASATGVLDGQETLAGRQQRLAESQAYQQLAAHPENLIQAALMQGARRPGGIPVTQAMTTPVDASGNPIGPGQPGAAGGMGSTLVPIPAIIAALQQRAYVPAAGPVNAQGSLVSLDQLQNDPNLRITAGNLDLASLGHLGGTERGYLASVLGAQAQDLDAFNEAVKRAGSGQRSSGLVSAL